MATELDIINDCLATMGEVPLNTVAEPHEMKGAILRTLDKQLEDIQATGWWFNTDATTLAPDPSGMMYLPGDCLKWQSGVRSKDSLTRTYAKPWLVERGSRLYDTRNNTYLMTEEVTGEVVRCVPLEDLPAVVNRLVAAATVLKFQSNYDGDNNRRAELTTEYRLAKAEAHAENTRQAGVNLLNSNPRLQRIKRVVRQARW
jgi:hypothetical protein